MKKIIFIINLFISVQAWPQKYEPIVTTEKLQTDTFFKKYIIEDKYRWLEDFKTNNIKDWIDKQDAFSKKYLAQAIKKTNSYDLIDKYNNVNFSNFRKIGKYYFILAYYGETELPSIFYKSKIDDDPELLVDPAFISIKDKILISDFTVSKNSKYLTYTFSRNGSDWKEARVVSLETMIHKNDKLTGIKFSNIAWMGDGFFYTTFSQDNKFAETKNQKVLYHKIGDEQKSDTLVYQAHDDSQNDFFTFETTTDEQFLFIKEKRVNSAPNFYYIDYKSEHPNLNLLDITLNESIHFIDSKNGKFIVRTSNNKILEIDPENPSNQRIIVKEKTDTLLLNVIPFTDRMVAVYKCNQRPIIMLIDYQGKVLFRLKFPIASSVSGFYGNGDDEDLLFSFTTYTTPTVVYKFNIKTFKKELLKKTSISFKIDDIEYKEVEYLSTDNVLVPMILIYKKSLELNGNNPTILKAYGGFGVVETPSFDPGIVYFIKEGGVFAFANIRGGGDKGIGWALQGKGKNKQKSFDDFIAAAEYLIKNKYTSKNKLAATGGSNGGLVVAVAAIQRPDLFKAVVPIVGPFDMVRFEKFTVGKWWTEEYGTVSDSASFTNMLKYSPYHTIKEDVNYPSMLLVTGENDDRVPPFHTYKFAAKLQSRSAQKNPIILKVQKKSGHNGAILRYSQLQEDAEIYGFMMNELMKD